MATTPSDSVTTPRSITDLTNLATSQVTGEIGAQEAPLQSQISDLQSRETNSLQKLGEMFGTLQPYVQGAAGQVQDSYNTAFQAQQSIFNTAMQRMNQMKQDRAQAAQTMAQQVGGPVAVGEFTASALAPDEELSMTAPNALTHALANAEAGVQEANAFSGQVFPLIQTEQTANMKNYFETQIKDINDQISTLEGSKQGAINTRLNDLLEKERTFQQNQQQINQQKIKDQRDYQIALRTQHNQDIQTRIAQQEAGLRKAAVTGTYQGKPTLAARQQATQDKLAAKKFGLDYNKYMELVRHHQVTEAAAQTRAAAQAQKNAASIATAAYTGGKSTISLTQRRYLDPNNKADKALINRATWDPTVAKDISTDSKHRPYINQKVTLTPQQAIARGINIPNAPITDPQALYDYLRKSKVAPGLALTITRNQTHIHDFSPGATVNYTPQSLATTSNKDLLDLAVQRGYKKTGHAGRKDLINFIIQANPEHQTP